LSHHPKVEGISFSTNLVIGQDRIQAFLDQVNLQRLGMGVTLHDTQIKDIDGFFQKVEAVQKRGVLVYVGYVGLPDRFDDISAYKQRLDDMGVPFILNEYNGSTQNAPYPQAYTAGERDFLRQHFFSEHYYRMLVQRESPKGQYCLAGHRYIYLNNKGQIFNCGMDRNQEWELEWNGLQKLAARFNAEWARTIQTRRVLRNCLGNILDDGFQLELKASPRLCPYPACTCGNEVQAMKSVGRDYYRTRALRVIYPRGLAAGFEAKYPNLAPIEIDPD
jgi:hypothetical protein